MTMMCGESKTYAWYFGSRANIAAGPEGLVSDNTYTFLHVTACQPIRQISISMLSSNRTVRVEVQADNLKTYYSIVDVGLKHLAERQEKGYYFNSDPSFSIDENGHGDLKFVEDAVGDDRAFEDRPLGHTFFSAEPPRDVMEALTLLSKVDASVKEINSIMQKVFNPSD